jgi:O-antigen ligase
MFSRALGSPGFSAMARRRSPARPFPMSPNQRTVTTWVVILSYLTLVGGAPGTEFNGWVRALNWAIALTLIVRWVTTDPRSHDATDRGMLLALLGFLAACVLSEFPRQSFDAALQATALVAGFHFARRMPGREGRASIEVAAGWLCVGVSILVCVAWGTGWVEWLLVSGGVSPPLSLPLNTGPFGHRHDVGLLVVLLGPALWSPPFRKRRAVSILGTALVAAIVLIDSSRNVEVALLAATAVVFATSRRRPTARALRIAGVVAVAGAISAAALLVLSPVLMSRVANVANLLTRFTLWGEAGQVWVVHPLAGIGPGAFPFSYMMTDHFRFSLFDPRHPDNAVVQLLVEAGVLGLGAAVVCVATFVRAAGGRYHAEPRAAWAILVFAFATLGANPTDFVFLLTPLVVWAAILVPASGGAVSAQKTHLAGVPALRGLRVIRTSGLAILAVAIAFAGAAGISYELGRGAYLRGDNVSADSALGISVALDPSLAIYRRERASLAFARGDLSHAVSGYRQSLRISPLDPVAWRGLALALIQAGDIRSAVDAADQAVDLMFLSPQNQLVRAATARGDPLAFDRAMRVVLQSAPWFAVISWEHTALGFADRARTVRDAVDPVPSPASGGDPFLGEELLAIIADRADVAVAMAPEVGQFTRGSAAALAAVAECDAGRSLDLLQNASKSEIEAAGYWIVRALVLAASDKAGAERDRAAALSLRFFGLSAGRGPSTETALAGNISDAWRYRRTSFEVAAPGAVLPSGGAGMWGLLTDPKGAILQLGNAWPPSCKRDG